jgi:maltose O-acetyltransferase
MKNSMLIRVLLRLNSIWFSDKIYFIKYFLILAFKFPSTTNFNKGFYCSSPKIKIGENVGLADTYIIAHAPISIGENCSFSYRNMIISTTHDINNFNKLIAKPIRIGNNCWITTNVTILGGVTIGDNTIIGAGSVVTKDIPSNVFAAGNPCQVIKSIVFNK